MLGMEYPRTTRLLLWVCAGTVLALLALAMSLEQPMGADSPGCRSICMYPSYSRVRGLDATHTRFATKYNVFLYREQHQDTVPDEELSASFFLDGVPVLFIPGNAGSMKQVRSIASETSHYFHKHSARLRGKNVDFFAAHFNEDLTAFHGRTLLDQAEYLNDAVAFILSLYAHLQTPPTAVVVIAHSMGGVVARTMLTLPNYQSGSVNTILTLAAPHAAAPATFDGDIVRVYDATDEFWRSGFSRNSSSVSYDRLKDVAIVSITGGGLDSVLPADYTTMKGLVPWEHGFTVYTTGMPQVWTPIDHLAIVWCDQLRKLLSLALFDVLDPHSPTRTKPLDERMRLLRRRLLSGFEVQPLILKEGSPVDVTVDQDVVIEGQSGTLNGDSLLHIIKLNNSSTFNLLTTSIPETFMMCNGVSNTSDLRCIDLQVHPVPNTLRAEYTLHDSSNGGDLQPMYAKTLDPYISQNYTHVIIKSSALFTAFSTSSVDLISSSSSLGLAPSSLLTKITFPKAWSSLLIYSIKVHTSSSSISASPFQPFMRQYIQDPNESKWHLQLDQPKIVSFHSIAPFTPFSEHNPVSFDIWTPLDTQVTNVHFKIDYLRSLKLLMLRYRLAIAAFPAVVITLTMIFQFEKYFSTGIFPTFEQGLVMLIDRSLLIFVVLCLLTPLASFTIVQDLLSALAPVTVVKKSSSKEIHLNQFFLGLEGSQLCILGPMLFAIALSLVYIVLLVVRLLLFIIPMVISLAGRLTSGISSPFAKNNFASWNSLAMHYNRRLVGSSILIFFVMVYIPYQFAFAVSVLVQAITTIRECLWTNNFVHKEKPDPRSSNVANFNISILMLMLWILPVNIPVLIVFFHNVAVRWETPFTSHHNILAILPIILLVVRNAQGVCLPQTQGIIQRRITFVILSYFAFFALMYGIRHLYWLHYLLNFFAAWLFILSFPSMNKNS